MKLMLIICIAILIFAVFTYDKWSYKAWYERCVKKGTGYDIDGNYYDHNRGIVYYNDGSVEKIDYQNFDWNSMGRLTRKSLKTDMIWFVDHDNNVELEPCEMSPIHNRLVLQKLAEYEDTGLTPQKIKQMKLQIMEECEI